MYYLRSTIRKLAPDKQRAVRDRIVAGLKIHSKMGTFPVSDMAILGNLDEIIGLIGLGEIQVEDGTRVVSAQELQGLKVKTEPPKVQEPPPAPKPEPPALPPDPPDLPVDVIKEGSSKPEPAPEPEPVDEPEEDSPKPGYTKADLEAMTKEQLLELASELGIASKVHHRDVKNELVKKIWKVLK